MASTATFVFLACLLQAAVQAQHAGKDPLAVVLEYGPYSDTWHNVEKYDQLISGASAFVSGDIVVFPEGTLTKSHNDAVPVPDPKDKIIPFKHPYYSKYPVISRISQYTQQNEIYVVVNLLERANCTSQDSDCPARGYYIYNTNVAFDRKGTVIARYRKFNLFHEFLTDKPKTAELSTFTTDFGITFGMFTCFDILFKTPAIDLVEKKNVTHLVFPTFWFGEMPFLTSVQIQSGWSWAMNVTLLASGANNPGIGSTGSGVFFGRRYKNSWMVEKQGDGMITGKLSGNGPLETGEKSSFLPTADPARNVRTLNLKQDPTVASANSKVLDPKANGFKGKVCHNQLCCNFDIKYNRTIYDNDKYSYKAVAFQGSRHYRAADGKHQVEYCAVLLCVKGVCTRKPTDGEYPLHFHQINIQADFKASNSLQMPNTLVWKERPEIASVLDSMDYSLFTFDSQKKKDVNKASISLISGRGGAKNLITFGLYGRRFD